MVKSLGISYPLQDDNQNGYMFKVDKITSEFVKSSLLLLLTTEKGTRFYFRDFGTNLKKFFFEQNDNVTWSDVEEDIKITVSKYLPKITVTSVTSTQDTDNSVIISTTYNYTDQISVQSDILSFRIG